MIIIKLKEIKLAYERRIGRRCTWDEMARRIGIPKDTLMAMSNRTAYNTTLLKINMICEAMNVGVADVLEYRPSSREKRGSPRKKQ